MALSPKPALSRVKFFILLAILKLGASIDTFLGVCVLSAHLLEVHVTIHIFCHMYQVVRLD
jgi:hypothetical protein